MIKSIKNTLLTLTLGFMSGLVIILMGLTFSLILSIDTNVIKEALFATGLITSGSVMIWRILYDC